ncbi:hypothetical protein LCGC14_0331670 [marine sediment metagenome]|uniref:Uncharacterized protein n=1 Tax=marine sediment metagenome TaxID=412755 RepID=A0A0F9WNH4_9ZZZZ
MGKRVASSHPSDMTTLDWAKVVVYEAQWYRQVEKTSGVQNILSKIEKEASALVEACRKQIDTTPSVIMALFKDHLLEELSKVVYAYDGLGYLRLKSLVAERSVDERLPPGRTPRFTEYRIGVYRKDAEGKDPVMVGSIHVAASDDPGINVEALLPLVCLWIREYAEGVGLGIKFEHEMESYAKQL